MPCAMIRDLEQLVEVQQRRHPAESRGARQRQRHRCGRYDEVLDLRHSSSSSMRSPWM